MNSGGDDRYACPGLVPDGGDAYPCGLWLGHARPCTPFVSYLPLPLLHPLDAWLVPRRLRETGVACPNGHGERRRRVVSRVFGANWVTDLAGFEVEGPVAAYRRFEGGRWLAPEFEAVWRFEPCGCEFRQVLGSAGA